MRLSSIRSLLWKETRQLGRNRTAMLTAAMLPFIILFLAPIQLLVATHLGGGPSLEELRGAPLPGLSDVTDSNQLLVQFFYPMLLVIGGLLLPSLTTTYAIVAAPAIPRMTSSVRTTATYGRPMIVVTAKTARSFAARISATVTGSEMSSSSERRSRSATIAYVVVREGSSRPPITSSIG